MPTVTLKDLENRELITLSHSFDGSNIMDMETGLNNIFLRNIESIKNNASLRLTGETTSGSEVTGYIRSNNPELLKEIKNEIEKLKDKSISEVYYAKLDIKKEDDGKTKWTTPKKHKTKWTNLPKHKTEWKFEEKH